jgi:hypothetical protein
MWAYAVAESARAMRMFLESMMLICQRFDYAAVVEGVVLISRSKCSIKESVPVNGEEWFFLSKQDSRDGRVLNMVRWFQKTMIQ